MSVELAILALFVFIYSLVAGRVERSVISGPMIFVVVGFLVPLMVLIVILGKAVGLMMVIAQPLGSAERIGLEIEKLPDGRSMVYIPSAPSSWSGVTQILPANQITYVDVPVTKVMELTEKYGHGVDVILQNKRRDDES